jgi:lipoprotein NlpI
MIGEPARGQSASAPLLVVFATPMNRLTTLTAGRCLVAWAAATLAAAGAAQWKTDVEACSGGALPADQRIEMCSKALQSKELPAQLRAAMYNNRGVAWKEKGNLGLAIEDYDQAVTIDPAFANAYDNRGAALGAKGDLDAAISDFDRAIRLDADLARAYENRSLALRSRGDLDGAIRDLGEVIRLEPKVERNYVDRAVLWEAKGDLGKATADLGEAIRLDPLREELFVARGVLWDRQHDPVHSIADYDEAIRLNPRFAPAYNNRCNTWMIKEAYDQARADCSEAIRLDPELAQAHFNRGVLFEIADDNAKARGEFDQAIRLDARFAPAYKSRAALSFYDGQFDAAQADLSRAAGMLHSDPYVAIWLYLAQARAGRGEAAAHELAQARPEGGDAAWPSPVIDLYLGRRDPGSVFKAAQQGDAGTQRDQQCEAAFYVGQWNLLQGNRNQALRLFDDAQRNCRKSFSESGGARAELDRMSR